MLWNVVEQPFSATAVRDLGPFGLVTSLLGGDREFGAPAAAGLLLAYVAVAALAVHRWALPRDLT